MAADGTVDWWCPGPLQGPPRCWSLLDPAGAALRVGPAGPAGGPPGRQRYRPGSLVAETDLAGPAGRRVRVSDALPWAGPGVAAPGRLVRVVEALAGPVEVEVIWRPGAGWRPARRVVPTAWGAVADRVAVRAGVRLEPHPVGRAASGAADVVWRGVRRLDAGERLVVTVDDLDDLRHPPLPEDAALRLLDATAAAWRWWGAPVAASGPHAAVVAAAAVVLRSLSPADGPPAGAGTTSLPRWQGGSRTADGRWVRWRHAAAATGVWARLGLPDEAAATEAWLREAVDSVPWPWPAALGPDASAAPEAEELALAGWRHSQPVRVGVGARLDLDAPGDVVAAVSASTGGGDRSGRPGGTAAGPLTGAWAALAAAADRLGEGWAGPDAGVWGLGGPPRALTATRVQVWAALDRMGRLGAAADPLSLDAAGWRQAAGEVLAGLERSSTGPDGALLAVAGDRSTAGADAALLRVAWRGPWPAGHPVVMATVERVLGRLGGAGPWVQRLPEDIDDGVGGADGADVEASLWAVRALAALGRWEEAHERMEGVLAAAGPLGLLSEAVDPRGPHLLGDLPSAGAHLAVVEAALALAAGPS